MDQQTLLTIFVMLAAVAMLIQAAMLVGLFVVARTLQKKVTPLLGPTQNILETSKRMIGKVEGRVDRIGASVENHIDKIGSSSSAILDTTKQQLVKVDGLLNDATNRAKSQMDRAEMVLDDTITRVHQTVSTVQSGVLRPVREVHGLFAGVRGALSYLRKSGRATVDHATSDEEMFI